MNQCILHCFKEQNGKTSHNIENCQFLQDPSLGFLGKNNGENGHAQWVCRNAMDK